MKRMNCAFLFLSLVSCIWAPKVFDFVFSWDLQWLKLSRLNRLVSVGLCLLCSSKRKSNQNITEVFSVYWGMTLNGPFKIDWTRKFSGPGIVVKQVKLLLGTPIWVLVQVLAALIPNELYALLLGRQRIMTQVLGSLHHVGDPDGVHNSRLLPVAFGGLWLLWLVVAIGCWTNRWKIYISLPHSFTFTLPLK